MSIKSNLTIDDWSREGPTGLVDTSVVCSDEGTNDGIIMPDQTFFPNKVNIHLYIFGPFMQNRI